YENENTPYEATLYQADHGFNLPTAYFKNLETVSSTAMRTGRAVMSMIILPANSSFPAVALSPASLHTSAPKPVRYAIPTTFNTVEKYTGLAFVLATMSVSVLTRKSISGSIL